MCSYRTEIYAEATIHAGLQHDARRESYHMVAAITYVVLLLIDRAQEQIKLIVLKSRAVEEERKVLTTYL